MDPSRHRFTSDEVSSIVRRALSKGGTDDVSYEDLEEIARQSGISVTRLQSAIREEEREGQLELAREKWKRRRKQKFFHHLRAYCIVNGILLLLNLATTGFDPLWVIFPILGWGFGIAFDASDAFFPDEARVERGARRLLRRETRERDVAYDNF